MNRLETEVPLAISEVPGALDLAAQEWGAEWQSDGIHRTGGRLVLPVVFGLRRGVLVGRVEIEPAGDGARLTWTLDESHLEVQRSAVAILILALAFLLPALAWPFHPPLLALLPMGAVLGLLAWWLVISRLRNSGPEEFFATVASPAGVR